MPPYYFSSLHILLIRENGIKNLSEMRLSSMGEIVIIQIPDGAEYICE